MSLSTTETEAVWSQVLDIVKDELNEASFTTWFLNTVPLELTDDGVFVAGVQNEFARSWLEERYSQRLSAALRQVLDTDVSVRIVVDSQLNPSRPAPAPEAELPQETEEDASPQSASAVGGFSPKYTFDSFIVGESNVFARNAALAVAEQPGLKYNPLFIWGGPGLGKTHLLLAIGNYVTQNYPHKKVMYVTSEKFTNDFINSINTKRQDSFRQKYRSVDVLLIDDIQFLEKKEGTLDQFFNTFNDLQSRGKAIVMASDRPAKDFNIDERMRSRFISGLPADIQPPNFEIRMAILRQFVSTQNMFFTDEALAYVAERSTPNIREMEGAVNRIIAFAELSRRDSVDMTLAEQVTRDIFPEHATRPISISVIQREVCKFYNVSHADLVGSKRSQAIVFPRQVGMYLSRELTDLSLPKIGAEFGGRDHTTVMHATAKIQKLMSGQREVYTQIQQLTNTIKQKA